MQHIKNIAYQICLEYINKRIENAHQALQQAQEASTDDTKSSAGDKFETTREMMQQEIDRNKKALLDANRNLHFLKQCENASYSDTIKNGSLVFTNHGAFYVAISVGQLEMGDMNIFAISPISPIGKLLIGKREGDKISFNKKDYKIETVA